jgi:hypothetical protein
MRFPARRAAFAAAAVTLAAAGCAQAETHVAKPKLETVEVQTAHGVRSFQVEIADTDKEREHGLMDRDSMAADHGMLFQFPDSTERAFWMHDTRISLDIVFIGSDGRIVSIQKNAKPYDETPLRSYGNATGVLEINGGLADRLGIKPGDVVRHPFFRNR